MISIWLTAVLIAATVSGAQGPRKISIQSSVDKFDLIITGQSGRVDGKPADLSAVQDLLPLLTNPLGNECPSLSGAPDFTTQEGSQTRKFYVKQGMITDGTHCLNVGGDGLYYFPIHRDFLIGAKRESIEIKSPFKMFRQGTKVLDLKKQNEWVSEVHGQLLNWDFFERMLNSLSEFNVRLRVQEGLSKGKPKILLQIGDQSYEFVKITNIMWALKRPGAKWLVASDDWSFWYDLDTSVIEDRLASDIRAIANPELSQDVRLRHLAKVENTWSPNLRDLYHKLLLRDGEDRAILEVALKRLRRKPSPATSGVLIEFISGSHDENLLKEACSVLRVQDPKGPAYVPKASAADKQKVLSYWKSWWQRQSK